MCLIPLCHRTLLLSKTRGVIVLKPRPKLQHIRPQSRAVILSSELWHSMEKLNNQTSLFSTLKVQHLQKVKQEDSLRVKKCQPTIPRMISKSFFWWTACSSRSTSCCSKCWWMKRQLKDLMHNRLPDCLFLQSCAWKHWLNFLCTTINIFCEQSYIVI